MKKYYSLIILGLLFIFTLFWVLILSKKYTLQIWTVLIFDIIAFLLQGVIWFQNEKSSRKEYYKYPVMVVSLLYLLLQMGISITTALLNTALSFKLVLGINFSLLGIMCSLLLLLNISKGKIESLDSRQKDHHRKF